MSQFSSVWKSRSGRLIPHSDFDALFSFKDDSRRCVCKDLLAPLQYSVGL